VCRVACREPATDAGRSRRDQAVRLGERDAAAGELAPPRTGTTSLSAPELDQLQPIEEQARRVRLAVTTESAVDLLHIDGTDVWAITGGPQCAQAGDRASSAPKEVDEDGGVEQDGCHSADPALVGLSLRAYPGSRILVPLVVRVGDGADGSFQGLPAPLVVEGTTNGLGDEAAATPGADTLVQAPDIGFVEGYV
jgi:hypothetical protein